MFFLAALADVPFVRSEDSVAWVQPTTRYNVTAGELHPPYVPPKIDRACVPIFASSESGPISFCRFVARPYAIRTTGIHSLGRSDESSARFDAETPPASTSRRPGIATARSATRATPRIYAPMLSVIHTSMVWAPLRTGTAKS